MRVTYDEGADGAYIYLDPDGAGSVAATYSCDPIAVDGMINLDFDEDGVLIGVEVMDAGKRLPAAVLETAERIRRTRGRAP